MDNQEEIIKDLVEVTFPRKRRLSQDKRNTL